MSLPNEQDIADRLGTSDPANEVLLSYQTLSKVVLSLLSNQLNIPLPAVAVSNEYPALRSDAAFVLTEKWPVNSITSAAYLGQTLTVGTLAQLVAGTCSIAIGERGEGVRLWTRPQYDGPGALLLTYNAGLSTFPDDLYEVWYEWVRLLNEESGRVGKNEQQLTSDAKTIFVRMLPDWCRRTLYHYRRAWAGA